MKLKELRTKGGENNEKDILYFGNPNPPRKFYNGIYFYFASILYHNFHKKDGEDKSYYTNEAIDKSENPKIKDYT